MEISGREARELINRTIQSVEQEIGYKIVTDFGRANIVRRAFCVNTPEVRRIGLDLSWFNDRSVLDERAFAGMFTALFHEVQHAKRYNELDTGQGDLLIMALTIVDNINRNYYLANYANNLRELDAEAHAFTNACSALAKEFGRNEAERMVLSVVKKAKELSQSNEHSLYHGLPISNDDDYTAVLRCYVERMRDVRNGRAVAIDWRYSEKDPAFQFIQNNIGARRVFERIEDCDFSRMTEFLAAVSMVVDTEIRDEFPGNKYLQKLDIRKTAYKIANRRKVRSLVFADEIPEWYTNVSARSEKCVETVMQMFE